ncbi:MAG: VOC family protein [candidate division Zixibacteria bacterium]|nr:VOC family protein [candidate division Zixibacteria bacterium]MDH3936595.1 VOC family protein [candidate division Zixibacteria bacterium]MDH4033478.1 VOC family protein [candidate division Zixibacteria bacterium]
MSEGKPTAGMFCWNELMTRDTEGASKFYSELLGWSPTDSGMPGMKYTLMKVGDKDAGGMMTMPPEVPEQVPAHWMSYVTVDDVDAAAAKAPELGGQVMHGPADIPGVGRFCVVQDPGGATFGMITFPKGE